jgi:hypothetical protein
VRESTSPTFRCGARGIQADATFFRLDEDNLSTKCMGNSKKPVCLVALVAAQGDEFSQQDAVADAAKKYRNDPLSFAWLDAPTQQVRRREQLVFCRCFGAARQQVGQRELRWCGRRNTSAGAYRRTERTRLVTPRAS